MIDSHIGRRREAGSDGEWRGTGHRLALLLLARSAWRLAVMVMHALAWAALMVMPQVTQLIRECSALDTVQRTGLSLCVVSRTASREGPGLCCILCCADAM